MARRDIANLTNTDIEALKPAKDKYPRVVGNPKELKIMVYPTGRKSFFIEYKDKQGKTHKYTLHEYRKGIYTQIDARKEATNILHRLINGESINEISGKESERYLLKNLVKEHLADEYEKVKMEQISIGTYEDKIRFLNVPLELFGDKDIKFIEIRDLKELFDTIKCRTNPNITDNDKIRRICYELRQAFHIGIRDRHISYNIINDLLKMYPRPKAKHYETIIKKQDLKEFIILLKEFDTNSHFQFQRMIFLALLTGNRIRNIAEAKWKDINLDKHIWIISKKEMKKDVTDHIVPLNTYATEILKMQWEFSKNREFVFPKLGNNSKYAEPKNEKPHASIERAEQILRDLGGKDNYRNRLKLHGFRSILETTSSIYESQIIRDTNIVGSVKKICDEILAHKESDQVKQAYERTRAIFIDKLKFMQWYGNYLNEIESLGFGSDDWKNENFMEKWVQFENELKNIDEFEFVV